MRAIQVLSPGGPERLALLDGPEPEPGPGQVLVEVAAAGVNFVDVYHRAGVYPGAFPRVLGVEGAGTVLATGPGVSDPAPGDRVAWYGGSTGSYSSHAVVAAEHLVPVPEDLGLETAAASLLQGLTALALVDEVFPVSPGQTVLVHAGAGGVGQLLTRLARERGARVVTTVSSAAKEEVSRAAGAWQVLRYDLMADLATELPARVRELTDGEGVHTVFDGVGRATFDASLASLRRRGGLALFGAASGQVPPVDPQRLNRAGSVFLTRPSVYDYATPGGALERMAAELFGLLVSGRLEVEVSRRYRLEEAARAHRDLESRATTGKLVLLP